VQGLVPPFRGVTRWLNTEPLTLTELHGKVVVVQFWTYTCINWLRTLPYVRAWSDTYSGNGLVVVGVHTPEFVVEHDVENVRRAVRDLGIEYPIAIDNDYAVWNAFANQYWPAIYIADAEGGIRHHHFGEGGYDKSERVIRHLLSDVGTAALPPETAPVTRAIEVPADTQNLRSYETYVGVARSEGFASPEGVVVSEPRTYTVPARLRLNEWALAGSWTVGGEEAVSNEPRDRLAYRFHARDVNLILSPAAGQPSIRFRVRNLILSPAAGQPSIRFRVRLDGHAPGDAHGLDVDEEGNGVIEDARLYQLVRQPGQITDRTLDIEFVDPGAAALCFTFG
jgi:thiol-disulfide isomerase/thioredoxin